MDQWTRGPRHPRTRSLKKDPGPWPQDHTNEFANAKLACPHGFVPFKAFRAVESTIHAIRTVFLTPLACPHLSKLLLDETALSPHTKISDSSQPEILNVLQWSNNYFMCWRHGLLESLVKGPFVQGSVARAKNRNRCGCI